MVNVGGWGRLLLNGKRLERWTYSFFFLVQLCNEWPSWGKKRRGVGWVTILRACRVCVRGGWVGGRAGMMFASASEGAVHLPLTFASASRGGRPLAIDRCLFCMVHA